MRALFVDDEVEFLELMHKRLTRRGMDVITAPDGQTALKLLDQAIDGVQDNRLVLVPTCKNLVQDTYRGTPVP